MASEKPTVVPVEFAGIDYAVNETSSGQLAIKFVGHSIPSLPGIRYGLALSHGTSREQAELGISPHSVEEILQEMLRDL